MTKVIKVIIDEAGKVLPVDPGAQLPGGQSGSLPNVSYLRPGKLFTANEKIMNMALGLVDESVLTAARSRVSGLVLQVSSMAADL